MLKYIHTECYFQEPTTGKFHAKPLIIYPFNSLQKAKVVVWLYDNVEMRIHGRIIVSPATPVLALNFDFVN